MSSASAPIDKDVIVPQAVRRAAARADAVHQAAYSPNQTTAPAAPPAPAVEPPPAPVATAPAAPVAAPVSPAAADEGSWEDRYKAMKGRFEKAQLTANQLTDRVTGLESLVATLQRAPAQVDTSPAELSAKSLITAEEAATWGPEMMDIVGRRALEAVKPEFDALKARNAELERQLAGVAGVVTMSARDQMMKDMDTQLPTWREQNNDAAFLNWLRLPDTYSGVIRQTLLKSAFDRNDTARVLAFFRGFLAEEAVVAPALTPTPQEIPAKPGLEAFAAPGRAKSAAASQPVGSPEKPIITRAQIAQFYADVRANKYAGKEAEKNRLEEMIFAAERDGRIR